MVGNILLPYYIQCICSHAAMQLMVYAPNSPSIQKRFGIAILYGNKMFPSLEYDWMQIVHTPPCYLPISRFEMYTV